MAENVQSKVCPLCAETIKAAARKCPFCQSPQSRWSTWRAELAGGAIVLLLCGLALFLLHMALPEESPWGGRRFAPHRPELVVTGVTVDWAKKRREAWVRGCVTNTGSYPWRIREFEARFFDARSNLFDVCQVSVQEPFVVEPGREHAFRVKLDAIAWTNLAVSTTLRVKTATDGHLVPID